MTQYPSYEADLFTEEGILTPYHHYKAIRDLGPIVHLAATDVLTLGRFDDVRKVLMDNKRFLSGKGVTVNSQFNSLGIETTLNSDRPRHKQFRDTLMKPMSPKALAQLKERVENEANGLIDRLVEAGRFEGVKDLATYLPVTIVAILVGLPADLRENMLDWAAASFDSFGPADNPRVANSMEVGLGLVKFMGSISREKMLPGSWADQLYQAADRGDITPEMVPAMLVDYVAPSLDTTIAATSQMLHQLGQNPSQWELLVKDPSLVPNVIEETLRIESPIRGFARVAEEDVEIDGVKVEKGSRLFLLYGSANRDERQWDNPETFDIQRKNVKKQMAFGFGIHQCAGQHLARLEITCLLNAMIKKVKRIEVSNPEYKANSFLRILESLDVSFH